MRLLILARRLAVVALCLATVLAPVGAETITLPFRSLRAAVPAAPVAILGITYLYQRGGAGRINGMCFSFVNLAARPVTAFAVHFRYYDAARDHVGDDEWTRTGSFARLKLHAAQTRNSDLSARKLPEDCYEIHYPHQGIAYNLYEVARVTFDDGSEWKPSHAPLAEQLFDPNAVNDSSIQAPAAAPSTTPAPESTP